MTPRSTEIDILCLLEVQSKPISPKSPAELPQSPVYPPKKLSGVPTLRKDVRVIRKQDQIQLPACPCHVIDVDQEKTRDIVDDQFAANQIVIWSPGRFPAA